MNYWHQKCIAWNVVYWFINRYRTNYVLQLLFIHILSIQSYELDRLRLKILVYWVSRWSSCKMIEIDFLRSHSNFDHRIAWRNADRISEDSEFLFFTKFKYHTSIVKMCQIDVLCVKWLFDQFSHQISKTSNIYFQKCQHTTSFES